MLVNRVNIYLQLVKDFSLLLIGFSYYFQFLLILSHSSEQLSIGILPSHELLHNVLHISTPSSSPNTLKSLLHSTRLLHLIIHLLLIEHGPHLLHCKVLPQLYLIRVLVLISCRLCNLTLPPHSVHSLLQCILLVLYRGLQTYDPLLSLLLLVVYVLHQVVQSVLRLQLVLLGCPLFIDFFIANGLLRLE